MPVGAFAARNEIMDNLSPLGSVYQAGTLSGNPLAMRAGLTTLQLIKEDKDFFNRINKTTETLDQEITKILTEKGIAHHINRFGSMMSVFSIPIRFLILMKLHRQIIRHSTNFSIIYWQKVFTCRQVDTKHGLFPMQLKKQK